MFEDRLGPIWYQLVKDNQARLQIGTVKTAFEIPAAGGHVQNLRVVSSAGGRTAQLIARQAILQLNAPPIPREILDEAHRDYLFFEESFTIYENRDVTSTKLIR